MKRTVAIMILALAMSFANAADIRALFINMPDSIMPALTKSERMDFLDYIDSGMKARVRNKLGGESEMTELSDNSLTVQTSRSGKLQMALFPRKDGTVLICLIKTVTAGYDDSRITFYNEDWTPVESESLIELPEFDDYLTKQALKQVLLLELKIKSILRLQSAVAVEGGLEFRYTSLDYIGEDADRFRSYFKADPVRYVWNGKRFKRK
jgi:hypothetical protein